jgi:pilus assembly protein Flp/PilA
MYQSIKNKVANFFADESGPTAVEYAVMLALILAVCMTAIGSLGTASFDMWSGNSGDIDNYLNGN